MGLKSFFKRNGKAEDKKARTIQITKKNEVPISKKPKVQSGCKNYLGFLSKRPNKSSKIPEECIMCVEVLNCLLHQ